MVVRVEIRAAPRSMKIMGSHRAFQKRFRRPSFFPSSSLFFPFFASLASASAALSPWGVESSSCKTCSGVSRYRCIALLLPERVKEKTFALQQKSHSLRLQRMSRIVLTLQPRYNTASYSLFRAVLYPSFHEKASIFSESTRALPGAGAFPYRSKVSIRKITRK